MTETRAGRTSAESRPSRASRSTTPSRSTGTGSAAGTARRTESCSTAETRTRSRPQPRSARWFASVPPLTKTTSSGDAATSAAISARADSITSRAIRPRRCTEEGLPQHPSAVLIAAAAAGRSGAVAFQSRYASRRPRIKGLRRLRRTVTARAAARWCRARAARRHRRAIPNSGRGGSDCRALPTNRG